MRRFKTLLEPWWYNVPHLSIRLELGRFLCLAAAFIMLVGCGTVKKVVVEGKTETITRYIDSLRITDSIRVIPIERVVDVVADYDTLYLETSLAEASAYVDSNLHILKGSIENKRGVEREVKYITKVVEKVDSVYIEKPVPYEVEKIVKKTPKLFYWSLCLNLLTLLLVALRLYFKFK